MSQELDVPERSDNTSRRNVLIASGAAVSGLAGLAGCTGGIGTGGGGGSFPANDIRLVIPFGPGGGTDFYGKTFAQHLPKHLPNDVDVVAENVEGTGGVRATNILYDEDPDGYTIMQGHADALTSRQLDPEIEVEYDMRDFTYLGSATTAVRGWFGNTDSLSGLDSWSALAAAIGNQDLIVATSGRGGPPHTAVQVAGELTGEYGAEDPHFVHLEAFGDIFPQLISQELDVGFGAIDTVLRHGEDEPSISAWGISDAFAGDYPELTPLSERGFPEDAMNTMNDLYVNYRILMAPPGLAEEYPDRFEVLAEASMDTWQDEEYLAAMEEGGQPVRPTPAEEIPEVIDGKVKSINEVLLPLTS